MWNVEGGGNPIGEQIERPHFTEPGEEVEKEEDDEDFEGDEDDEDDDEEDDEESDGE